MIYKENGVTIVSIDKLLIKYPNGNSIRQGWSPQCESYPSTVGKWGVLKTTAIQSDGFRANENKQLPDKLNAKEHLTVKSGDILVTCAGPRSRCGIPCYVEKAPQKLMISGKMYQLRVDERGARPHPRRSWRARRGVTRHLLSSSCQHSISESSPRR